MSAIATLTIYGWIGAIPAMGSGRANCPPISFPGSIQSVASYSGGVSGTRVPVDISVVVYGVPYCVV